MNKLYSLYIANITKADIISVLAECGYSAFTLVKTTGIYEGITEQGYKVELLSNTPEKPTLELVSKKLKAISDEACFLLTIQDVKGELI